MVRKPSLDEDRPESDKLRNSGALSEVRRKSTGLVPVFESDVALGSGTSVDADTEDPESNKRDNLDQSKPKFKFAEDINWQEVDSGDWDPENGDKYANREIGIPPLDDKASSSELKRVGDYKGSAPVICRVFHITGAFREPFETKVPFEMIAKCPGRGLYLLDHENQ